MEFPLIEKLSELSVWQWLLFGLFLILAVVLIVYLVRSRKDPEKKTSSPKKAFIDSKALAYGALCIAMSFVLSYIRIFRLPQGGSVTLCSILPVCLYAYWYGPKYGFFAAFVYSWLQLIQDPQIYTFVQVLLDYTVGFTVLGIPGLLRKQPFALGVAIAGLLRMLASFVSGAVFFGSYAPEGINPWLYSLVYQLSTLGIDTLVAVVVAFALQKTRVLQRIKPKGLPAV